MRTFEPPASASRTPWPLRHVWSRDQAIMQGRSLGLSQPRIIAASDYHSTVIALARRGGGIRPAPPRGFWETDRGIASRRCRFHGREDALSVVSDRIPMVRHQHDEGQAPACHVLLIANVLVGGDQHVVTSLFRRLDQVTVGQPCPPEFGGGVDRKPNNKASNADRHAFIKQDAAHKPSRAHRRGYALRVRGEDSDKSPLRFPRGYSRPPRCPARHRPGCACPRPAKPRKPCRGCALRLGSPSSRSWVTSQTAS